MNLDAILSFGFDRSYETEDGVRVLCSGCEALVINGIACHEQGCPNIVDDEDDAYFDDDEDYFDDYGVHFDDHFYGDHFDDDAD